MLIQGSLPTSINTELAFVSENGKQQKMDLCTWSHGNETWKKSANCEYPCDNHQKGLYSEDQGDKILTANAVELSRAFPDLMTVSDMCGSSTPKRESYVYKRRKLQRNTVALLSEESATATTKGSCNCPSSISFDEDPMMVKNNNVNKAYVTSPEGSTRGSVDMEDFSNSEDCRVQESTLTASIGIPKFVSDNTCFPRNNKVPLEVSVCNYHKPVSEHLPVIHDACSSSKSVIVHCSTSRRMEADDAGECSSTENVFAKSLEEFTSARELCIYVLQSHGLLNELWTDSTRVSPEVLSVGDNKCTQKCKTCGLLENPRNMLICDFCDEAFHVSCCNPKIKKFPIDEWYCLPCMRKRPKRFLANNSHKACNNINNCSENMRKRSDGELNPISMMLNGDEAYISGARIGKDFQVEVPEWHGPISIENDYFSEPSILDPIECAGLDGWNCNKPSKNSSIGNWVQCREVIYNDADGENEGTLCGKWRRAPLFVVQTDDWDCSCSVLWDPIHADCAVPQELETEVILKHLKYIQMLRPRLANSGNKFCQSKRDARG